MVLVYEFVSLIWNASRLPQSAERSSALDEVYQLLARALPQLPDSERRDLVQSIYRRARNIYPDDPRFIAATDVEDLGGGNFHVMVASVEA